MNTSSINAVEEPPEIQRTSGYPPPGEPIIHMEQHPQIEVTGPAIINDTERPSLRDQPFALAMEALAWREREDPKLAFQDETRRTVQAPVGVMFGKAYDGEEVDQSK